MTTTASRRPIPKATVTPRDTLPPLTADPPRIRIGRSRHEMLALLGGAAAGPAVGFLLGPVLGLTTLGWVPLVSYLWFVLTYGALISLTENGPAVRDRFWSVVLWSAGLLIVSMLFLVIGYTLVRGQSVFRHLSFSHLRHNFFTDDMSLTGPLSPLSEGGIFHALVGTIEQIGIALAITIPLGTATAVFLNEVGGRYARLVRTVVEAMTALPSVVAGLFIYGSVILLVTRQFNGFAASLAITVLMLPIMIRSADVVFRLVPGNLREAGLALGGGQWAVVRRVVLPTVRSGLTTAIILGTAHGIGETAPVLLTAGVTNNLNWNPFNGPQISLPLAALEFIKSPQPDMKARGFATAAFLMLVVLVLFVIARVLGGQRAGEVTDRQRRRLAVRSQRDLGRIEDHHARVAVVLAELRDPDPRAGVVDIARTRAFTAVDDTPPIPPEQPDRPDPFGRHAGDDS
ncbi:PstA family ABC transporter permease [Nocardioides sp. BP30]|uniref:PstA family ABC transporter permease n=1 Tax=Nocardioides sp. BP30 TaxID=3036374 RepID=UPI002469A3F6|nr:PstA family ABC transporter permease [Nocardioides sp. BP30]WGL52762.1 PstA family ABC transporter permease [Nocardioides sp. BP30]